MLVGVNCEMDFYWTNPVRVEEAARGFYTIWCCSSWSLPWDPSFASNLWDPLTKMQPWLLVCNGLVCVCWLEGFGMGLGKKSFLDTNQATTELCFFLRHWWDEPFLGVHQLNICLNCLINMFLGSLVNSWYKLFFPWNMDLDANVRMCGKVHSKL